MGSLCHGAIDMRLAPRMSFAKDPSANTSQVDTMRSALARTMSKVVARTARLRIGRRVGWRRVPARVWQSLWSGQIDIRSESPRKEDLHRRCEARIVRLTELVPGPGDDDLRDDPGILPDSCWQTGRLVRRGCDPGARAIGEIEAPQLLDIAQSRLPDDRRPSGMLKYSAEDLTVGDSVFADEDNQRYHLRSTDVLDLNDELIPSPPGYEGALRAPEEHPQAR